MLGKVGQYGQFALDDSLCLDVCASEAVAVASEVLLLHAVYEVVDGLDLA